MDWEEVTLAIAALNDQNRVCWFDAQTIRVVRIGGTWYQVYDHSQGKATLPKNCQGGEAVGNAAIAVQNIRQRRKVAVA